MSCGPGAECEEPGREPERREGGFVPGSPPNMVVSCGIPTKGVISIRLRESRLKSLEPLKLGLQLILQVFKIGLSQSLLIPVLAWKLVRFLGQHIT